MWVDGSCSCTQIANNFEKLGPPVDKVVVDLYLSTALFLDKPARLSVSQFQAMPMTLCICTDSRHCGCAMQ